MLSRSSWFLLTVEGGVTVGVCVTAVVRGHWELEVGGMKVRTCIVLRVSY